ncbi:MAG: amidase [Chthonomonas sp.]|nr:amidase [Chthonomonas sp.]
MSWPTSAWSTIDSSELLDEVNLAFMGFDTTLTRADLLKGLASVSVLGWLAPAARAIQTSKTFEITEQDLAIFEKALGLNFTDAERKACLADVKENFAAMRDLAIPYATSPATALIPTGPRPTIGSKIDVRPTRSIKKRPATDEDIAFLSVSELASLIKSKQLTPTELTSIYLERMNRLNARLNCVVSMDETGAMEAARKATDEIAAGRYRGPLHGIPYGIKDLFSTKAMKTTWGAETFKDQLIDHDATVVRKLADAGAILIAKLSLGALAMDDKWFGGQTKNPWNLDQGSSGSSAGPASALAAGLCGFTIGTETLGSIVSPSQRCRVTGLRPTFGRVSRDGAMALSWTMDKAGPICRTAEDCLLVLAAICGADPGDLSAEDRPLVQRRKIDLKSLKIGILDDGKPLDESDSNSAKWLSAINELGLKTTKVKITAPEPATLIGLSVEAAAAFDSITRTGAVNEMKYSLWPQIFRAHRYFTAVEYVQSLRQRTLAMQRFDREFADFDLILGPDRGAQLLLITNLTGHPQMYLPIGMDGARPVGMSIVGRLFDEATVCALGDAVQRITHEWAKRPAL